MLNVRDINMKGVCVTLKYLLYLASSLICFGTSAKVGSTGLMTSRASPFHPLWRPTSASRTSVVASLSVEVDR